MLPITRVAFITTVCIILNFKKLASAPAVDSAAAAAIVQQILFVHV